MQKISKTRKLLICYVRHGQTHDNTDGIIAGHQPGKLTKIGIDQAHQTGAALKNAQFDYVYVSDLNRTRETYQGIISKANHLQSIKVQYTSLIRQKCGGILEGKKISSWGQNATKQKKNIRNYKCSKGQSWEDVYERSHNFLHKLIKTHICCEKQLAREMEAMTLDQKKEKEGQQLIKILVVTHGGFIMQTHNLMNWISSKKPAVFANTAKNCSFHEFEVQYPVENAEKIDDSLIKIKCIKNNMTNYQ